MALNFALNVIFLLYFFKRVQNGGPALATSIAGYFNFLMLFIIFRTRFGRLGTFTILASMFKIVICSALMGLATIVGLHFSHFSSATRFLPQLGLFTALILGATVIYLALAWLFRCHEIEEVYGIAVRRERGEPGPPISME